METSKRSPTPENYVPEDPDTAAARKELRQTVISDKSDLSAMSAPQSDPAPNVAAGGDKASTKSSTPDRRSVELQNDDLKDQISSPKKKRAHDEVDARDATSDANGDISPIGSYTSGSLSRTDRSEPEKKRPRDVSSESKVSSDTATVSSESKPTSKTDEQAEKLAVTNDGSNSGEKKTTTSASAFSTSGISGFASQASPFLQAGSTPLSSFASPSSQSPFGAAAATKPATSVFGNSMTNGTTSPFGRVGVTTTFGSTSFGGSFASKLGGPTLASFGKPGESFKSNMPAKPFGAPVSDGEDNHEGDNNSGDEESDDDEEHEATEEKAAVVDDKKKTKLQRVVIDDGEAGEIAILQVRAKIFHLDKANSAWKERGAGNLKINVPDGSIAYDKGTGTPVPGSFKASGLKDAQSNVVRLVMRQDSTHRVILNTAIIPGMEFQEKSGIKATCVLFTALEDGGAVSIQLKMNAANAKNFVNEVGKIQRELQSV
ncbi:uncharacterized protein GGS22DRAFT_11719 [Annulohypoxylon maeteangense]|uniref:uncharacterized protein n=1 Tax=Annulohypoxylon maeteangense TaxID=1927788 RepID=UPI00200755F2|nr:uncharacterized protein GGS22DRAFT_11719 [Annulohypoxylon maeteangense]KAI0890308.1 hypothetical protein GGS22DRAFT_11719 [Annulohypoxylon maeteangense]